MKALASLFPLCAIALVSCGPLPKNPSAAMGLRGGGAGLGIGGSGGGLSSAGARPGFVVGTATFADGQPIPDFNVSGAPAAANGVTTHGTNGRYELDCRTGVSAVVQNVVATINISYHGTNYVLPLHPTDNTPPGSYMGNLEEGATRDFVFRLSGPSAASNGLGTLPEDTDSDSAVYIGAFDGYPMSVNVNLPATAHPPGSQIVITMTPDGPLVDGSTGKTLTKTVPSGQTYYHFYDLPLGYYTTTAVVQLPGGSAQPVHLKCQTEVTHPPTAESSVTVTWPYTSGIVHTPTLEVDP